MRRRLREDPDGPGAGDGPGNYSGRMEVAGRASAFQEHVRMLEEQLAPIAIRSYETRGRELPEEECGLRTPFQRDRDRIVHSKPFLRLKGKTKVFIDP